MSKPMVKYATWNCAGGMKKKKEYLEQYLSDLNLDALFINESEVKSNTNLNLLKIENYTLCLPFLPRLDRRCRICVYLKNSSNITQLHEPDLGDNDLIILKSEDIIVVGLYRQFKIIEESKDRQETNLVESLSFLARKYKNITVCGDFNFDYKRAHDPTYRNNRIANKVDQWSIEYGMIQIVEEYTRMKVVNIKQREIKQESLLDHVYTNIAYRVCHLEIISGSESDHDLVRFDIKHNIPYIRDNSYVPTKLRNWNKYDLDKVNDQLIHADWTGFESALCVEDMNNHLENIIAKVINRNIPSKTYRIKRGQVKDIKLEKLKLQRRRLYQEKKSCCSKSNQQKYKSINITIKNRIKSLKIQKLKTDTEKDRSTRPFWKFVKKETGEAQDSIPDLLKYGSQESRNGKCKADMFAQFFEENVNSKIKQTNPKYDQQELVGPFESMKQYRKGRLLITAERIENLLMQSRKSMATGCDETPINFYIKHKNILVPRIVRLFTLISITEKFPTSWKLAKIVPVFKKGEKNKIENYRPISNICSIAKVFEKLILQSIEAECEMSEKRIFGNNQHGFVKGRSTITAALTLQEKIAYNIDENKKCVAVTAIDMSAAFDLLDKDILRKRMSFQGYPHQTINLIHDWLSDRQAYVKIDNATSNVFEIKKGCIQGSVLGPTLFAILMSPLEELHPEIISYADDNYILHAADSLEELKDAITNDNQKIMEWLAINGMLVNAKKTNVTVFGRKKQEHLEVVINGSYIETQDYLTVLGINFDQQMNWSLHVQKTVNKLKGVQQCLRFLKKYLQPEELLLFVKTKIFGILYYGSEVWLGAHTGRYLVKKVDRVSKQNLKIAIGKDYHDLKSGDLYDLTGTYSPQNKSNLAHLQMLCKIWNKKDPKNIYDHLIDNRVYYKRRQNELFFINEYKLKFGMNCFSNRLKGVMCDLKFNPTTMNKHMIKMNFIKQFGYQE